MNTNWKVRQNGMYNVRRKAIYVDKPVKNGEIINSIIKNVPIVRRGRNKGFYVCCPFHIERTPSMWVTVNNDVWHCFGCGASNRYKPDPEKQRNLNNLRKIISIRYRQDQSAKHFNKEFAKEIEYTNQHIKSGYDYGVEYGIISVENDCPF